VPLDQVLAHERADQRRLGLTQDHLNAVEAFLNKRRPTFTGLA
jgi:2-(1,2-epoxy-1,2-dihydrophenyl)acetyl-CoA isomerase